MIVVFGKGKVGKSIVHLLTFLNHPYVLMDDEDLNESLLQESEFIIVSPGIKRISHVLWEKYEDKLLSELNFLARILPDLNIDLTTIGITATNGKSTTTWILYKALEALMPEKKVWITGNFDQPVSEIIVQILEGNMQDQSHILVIECSSFMLFGLQDWIFDCGIVLNVARDHLDWHKSWEEYRASKLILLEYARFGVTSAELFPLLDEATQEHTVLFTGQFDLWKTQFIGKHNQENLSAIAKIIYHLLPAISDSLFDQVLGGIVPLAHRLQLLREVKGIKIYDDGICTSSHSLHAALSAFEGKIIRVGWWYDKGDDYFWLVSQFREHVAFAVIMGQVTSKLLALCEKGGVPYVVVFSLDEGISVAFDQAQKLWLNSILYSPGAASFDMFANVYERVEKFGKIVATLGD